MAPIEVRNPTTGVKGTIRTYDHKRRIIRLTNRLTVVDTTGVWEYYNENENRWMKCFNKRK